MKIKLLNNMKDFPKEFERYGAMCQKYRMSRGMFGYEDLNYLLECASWIPQNGIYVEIGVANGSSLMVVAQFRPDVKCFGIEVNEGCKADKNIMEEKLENATVIFGKAETVCKTWNANIDMLFIDGEHYWPNIFWDVLGWMPFLTKDAVILFHDYEKPEEGKYRVGEAVQIFRDHPKYKCIIPSIDEIISTSMVILKRL